MSKIFIKTRNQLLFAFSCFTIIGVIIALVSIHYFSKVHNIYKVTSSIRSYHEMYIKAIDAEQEFLSVDISKSEYFKTGHSKYLELHDKYLSDMKENLNDIKSKDAFTSYGIEKQLNQIDSEVSKYETIFRIILDRVKVKGSREYGLEGRMTDYIYELEKISKPIGAEHILMLRKHEKDYLLRNDTVYVSRLDYKANQVREMIGSNQNITSLEKSHMENLLSNYQNLFMQLVSVTKEIGYKDEKGLTELLIQSKDRVDASFHSLYNTANSKEVVLVGNVQSSFYIIIVNLVLISLFLIYIFTRKLDLSPHTTAAQHASEPEMVAGSVTSQTFENQKSIEI